MWQINQRIRLSEDDDQTACDLVISILKSETF